jgi:membrane-associated phospholipid phosphatase
VKFGLFLGDIVAGMMVAHVIGMRRLASHLLAVCSFAWAVLQPAVSQADTFAPPKPVQPSMWKRNWPTFSRAEGVATLAAGAGTAVLFSLKPPRDARWQGGILFDDSVRSRFRLHSAEARNRVRSWGDLPYFTAPLLPLVVDPLVASWLVRKDSKAALNLELIGVEAFSYAGLLSFVSTRISSRERPDSSECLRTHDDPSDCEVDTESFYSGHTTIVAASAGLVCANHRAMPLWGSAAADVSACALATTGAVASGASRIAADRHYASDVVAGFGVGFGIGYAIPTLLHYEHEDTDLALSIAPGSPCTGACLKLAGSF